MGRQFRDERVSRAVSAQQIEGIEQIVSVQQQNPDRIVYLSGEVNEHSVANVITGLVTLANQDSKPIYLIVSTYGGSIDEMFSLYDMIRFLPCPIRTIGMGKVMSAGVLLLAAGEKGHRQIGHSARVMLHPITCGFAGNVFEMQAEVVEVRRQQDALIDALVRETKMSKARVRQFMEAGHDNYLAPSDMIKLGIVDKLIGT